MQKGKYIIRDVEVSDYKAIVEIYNSNPQFLLNHLGIEYIDEAFVLKEISNMKKIGFRSCLIVNRENAELAGILDYKSDREVYLSLIMLQADLQGKGLGSSIYSNFEAKMKEEGKDRIRIDVVNDYQDNLIPFWKGHGFLEGENLALEWGNKKSNAIVMRKDL